MFVLRENIGSWALGSAMSNLATAKALVAAYGYSMGHKEATNCEAGPVVEMTPSNTQGMPYSRH